MTCIGSVIELTLSDECATGLAEEVAISVHQWWIVLFWCVSNLFCAMEI